MDDIALEPAHTVEPGKYDYDAAQIKKNFLDFLRGAPAGQKRGFCWHRDSGKSGGRWAWMLNKGTGWNFEEACRARELHAIVLLDRKSWKYAADSPDGCSIVEDVVLECAA